MKPKFIILTLVTIAMLTTGCQQKTETASSEIDLHAEAVRLAHEVLMVDTHIDLPYRLQEKPDDVTVETEDGHFDLVRVGLGLDGEHNGRVAVEAGDGPGVAVRVLHAAQIADRDGALAA